LQIYKGQIDRYLLITTIALSLWGLFHLYTISDGGFFYYFKRQIIWVSSGVFLLLLFYLLPNSIWPKFAYFIYALTAVFLVVVVVKGEVIYGAKRWLGVGFFNFQPSELAKIALILSLSKVLSNQEQVKWKTVFFSFGLTIFFFFLIAIQPDLGTGLIIFSVWLILLFISGIHLRKFFILIGAIIASFPIFYNFLRPYQKMRILTYFNLHRDPLGAGWSSLQSKIAIGSGELFGRGIGGAAHTKLRYLPQPLTDFIFSSIGEEWGFIGVALIITAYLVIIIRGISIALREGNSFTGLFAAGFVSLIAVQAFVNMGMACGIIPVTGVPLPFISYGGSSTLIFLSATGVLFALNKGR